MYQNKEGIINLSKETAMMRALHAQEDRAAALAKSEAVVAKLPELKLSQVAKGSSLIPQSMVLHPFIKDKDSTLRQGLL